MQKKTIVNFLGVSLQKYKWLISTLFVRKNNKHVKIGGCYFSKPPRLMNAF